MEKCTVERSSPSTLVDVEVVFETAVFRGEVDHSLEFLRDNRFDRVRLHSWRVHVVEQHRQLHFPWAGGHDIIEADVDLHPIPARPERDWNPDLHTRIFFVLGYHPRLDLVHTEDDAIVQ